MFSVDFSVYNYFKNEGNIFCLSKFLLLKVEWLFLNKLYLGYFFYWYMCNNIVFLIGFWRIVKYVKCNNFIWWYVKFVDDSLLCWLCC